MEGCVIFVKPDTLQYLQLIESCKFHHSAIKSSKTHETIPFGSYNKLPSAVKEIKNDCSQH